MRPPKAVRLCLLVRPNLGFARTVITRLRRSIATATAAFSSVFVISQKNMVLVYFPNRGSCEEAIVMGLENGTLNNPKELR